MSRKSAAARLAEPTSPDMGGAGAEASAPDLGYLGQRLRQERDRQA
jgi:hypothetical protein